MLNRIIGFVIIVLSFGLAWVWMDYNTAKENPVITQEITFTIDKGDSFNRISRKLIQQQIPIKPFWFKVFAYQQGLINKLKAGEYVLMPGQSTIGILTTFAKGKTKQYSLTIPEGWQLNQVIQAIQSNPNIKHTLLKTDMHSIQQQLGLDTHPEGQFFPDTYFFEKDTTDVALLIRAFNDMQTVLSEEWQQRDENLVLKTPYEALILASIVEKETAQADERPLIAGVFSRRLKIGMRLQTDPTVIYGMGDDYHGNIRYKDLKSATPYNTYIISGLPPTPIALPGRAAIHAVLHPSAGNSLYFVARGDGSHVFSDNLIQHNRAVDIYQRKIK